MRFFCKAKGPCPLVTWWVSASTNDDEDDTMRNPPAMMIQSTTIPNTRLAAPRGASRLLAQHNLERLRVESVEPR